MIVKNNITFANLTFSMLNNVPKLPLTYNMQIFKPEFMFEQKLNVFALSNARHMLKKKEKFAFKVMLNIDVLIELFGTIIPCHYQLHLILLIVKILLDTLMELITKYKTTLTITKLLHF